MHPVFELSGPRYPVANDSDDEDADADGDWDARAEMNALVSGMTRLDAEGLRRVVETGGGAALGMQKTGGLLRCMVKRLNTVRWAVVREGMIVLKALVDRG